MACNVCREKGGCKTWSTVLYCKTTGGGESKGTAMRMRKIPHPKVLNPIPFKSIWKLSETLRLSCQQGNPISHMHSTVCYYCSEFVLYLHLFPLEKGICSLSR